MEAPPLKDLRYEVTSLCNQSCKHCMVDAGSQKGQELYEEEMLKIIAEAIPLGLEKFSLTGGEPLLEHRKVMVATKFCSDNKIYSRLFTNGMLLKRKMLEHLDEAGINEILVSVDGIGSTHDRFRGSAGSFESAFEALRELKGFSRIVSGARITITSKNYGEMPELFEKYLLPMNLTKINVRVFTPCGRARLTAPEYMLAPEQHATTFRYLVELQKNHRINFLGNCFAFIHGGEDKQCTCGVSQAYLNAQGHLKPCPYFNVVLGDCKRKSIGDIWGSDHPTLHVLRNPTAPDKCMDCEHYGNPCQGGCRASAYSVFKSTCITDPTCPLRGSM